MAAGTQTSPSGSLASTGLDLALSTTAQDVLPLVTSRSRLMVQNTDYATASGGTGISVWCRWGTASSAPAAAHTLGSWLLLPGASRDDSSALVVNKGPLNCIAESGSPILHVEQY
jgi:hypothetical protein